ncbi:MAG: hypothetical protein K0S55_789, partial [Clostridia bacterium]|nr:hypothetical protein [Clostridia bacterium]
MKKILSLLLSVIFCSVLLLSSCSGTSDANLPKTGIRIEIEGVEYNIHLLNEPMQEGAWAIYNRNYMPDGKASLTISPSSSDNHINDTVITVVASNKNNELTYKIKNVYNERGQEKSIDIPAGGFALCINYRENDKNTAELIDSEFKAKKEIKLLGYEDIQKTVPMEDETTGYIQLNDKDLDNSLRKLSLKNPMKVDDNKILFFDSSKSGNLPSAEDTYMIAL